MNVRKTGSNAKVSKDFDIALPASSDVMTRTRNVTLRHFGRKPCETVKSDLSNKLATLICSECLAYDLHLRRLHPYLLQARDGPRPFENSLQLYERERQSNTGSCAFNRYISYQNFDPSPCEEICGCII